MILLEQKIMTTQEEDKAEGLDGVIEEETLR